MRNGYTRSPFLLMGKVRLHTPPSMHGDFLCVYICCMQYRIRLYSSTLWHVLLALSFPIPHRRLTIRCSLADLKK